MGSFEELIPLFSDDGRLPYHVVEELSRKVIRDNKDIAYQYKEGDTNKLGILINQLLQEADFRCHPLDAKMCLIEEIINLK